MSTSVRHLRIRLDLVIAAFRSAQRWHQNVQSQTRMGYVRAADASARWQHGSEERPPGIAHQINTVGSVCKIEVRNVANQNHRWRGR